MRRVVLDTGVDAGDFPRGYALSTSTDGAHWREPAPPAPAQGQLTTIDFPATAARFLRVVQTATAPLVVVADVRVYR